MKGECQQCGKETDAAKKEGWRVPDPVKTTAHGVPVEIRCIADLCPDCILKTDHARYQEINAEFGHKWEFRHSPNSPVMFPTITDPGAYEGETLATPYFWQLAMNGTLGEDVGSGGEWGESAIRFELGNDDLERFPFLRLLFPRRKVLVLRQSSSGFISLGTP